MKTQNSQVAQQVLRLAQDLGGGHEGLSLDYNQYHDVWTASISVHKPRQKDRWRHGSGPDCQSALVALERRLRQERREAA